MNSWSSSIRWCWTLLSGPFLGRALGPVLSWDKPVLKVMLEVSSAQLTLCSRWKTKPKTGPRCFLLLKKCGAWCRLPFSIIWWVRVETRPGSQTTRRGPYVGTVGWSEVIYNMTLKCPMADLGGHDGATSMMEVNECCGCGAFQETLMIFPLAKGPDGV